jgi:hypothetical protein
MGDIIPLAQLRTLVNLVPRFGKQANRHLAKQTVLEYSLEFWLNKYFEKELFSQTLRSPFLLQVCLSRI